MCRYELCICILCIFVYECANQSIYKLNICTQIPLHHLGSSACEILIHFLQDANIVQVQIAYICRGWKINSRLSNWFQLHGFHFHWYMHFCVYFYMNIYIFYVYLYHITYSIQIEHALFSVTVEEFNMIFRTNLALEEESH